MTQLKFTLGENQVKKVTSDTITSLIQRNIPQHISAELFGNRYFAIREGELVSIYRGPDDDILGEMLVVIRKATALDAAALLVLESL